MLTTCDLLALVKNSHANCTDYRAAKLLGVSVNTPPNWIKRGSVMDDETAIKAAFLCGLDVEYVLACMAAERAKGSNSFPMWRHICERLEPEHRAA